jgi:uncharacterized protein with HEPN domain
MQPDEKDASYLLDMLEHARGVVQSLQGRDFEDYQQDENLRLAIERRIEIIGEAARRISPEFQQAHPEIPWRKIIAQRHVLAHDYGEIQDDILWSVGTMNLPELIPLLEVFVTDTVSE